MPVTVHCRLRGRFIGNSSKRRSSLHTSHTFFLGHVRQSLLSFSWSQAHFELPLPEFEAPSLVSTVWLLLHSLLWDQLHDLDCLPEFAAPVTPRTLLERAERGHQHSAPHILSHEQASKPTVSRPHAVCLMTISSLAVVTFQHSLWSLGVCERTMSPLQRPTGRPRKQFLHDAPRMSLMMHATGTSTTVSFPSSTSTSLATVFYFLTCAARKGKGSSTSFKLL